LHARDHEREERERVANRLDAAIDDVARISAIDGAVLAGQGLAIYGAGYLINSKQSTTFEVRVAEDVCASASRPMPPLTGARHRAAFNFAFDNPGGIAFVVSEDGPVRCAMRADAHVLVWPVRIPET
jgi:DNA integrity scanning protein DisA with diadenylate cyclase activity